DCGAAGLRGRRDGGPAGVSRALGDERVGPALLWRRCSRRAHARGGRGAMGSIPRPHQRRRRALAARHAPCAGPVERRAGCAPLAPGVVGPPAEEPERARGREPGEAASGYAVRAGRGSHSGGMSQNERRGRHVASSTPASARPNATACPAVNRSPRNATPTAAALIGSITVKTPADAALTCLSPVIQSHTVTTLAASA